MKDKTILVDTGFYTKTVNKEQFVKRWLDHVLEVRLIVDDNTEDQLEKLGDYEMYVVELAEKHFEKVYKRQNKKEAV
mgnify:FL=1|tara:strand:+ start:168 stop:398 length:231 start_codon:yes stop_codon:yes gene_type:complete